MKYKIFTRFNKHYNIRDGCPQCEELIQGYLDLKDIKFTSILFAKALGQVGAFNILECQTPLAIGIKCNEQINWLEDYLNKREKAKLLERVEPYIKFYGVEHLT